MMGHEPGAHQMGMGRLHVVHDDKSPGLQSKFLSEDSLPHSAAPRARGLAGKLPVSWLHVAVKNRIWAGVCIMMWENHATN